MMEPRGRQRGFAAIAAVFLLVVLAALGAFIVQVSSGQQLGSAQDVQSTRAYWAARAGVEWALGSLAAAPSACPVAPTPFVVEGFNLDVSCSSAIFNEAGVAHRVFTINARAASSAPVGGIGFVERSVSAAVEL